MQDSFKIFKTAPRSEVQCSHEVQLADVDVESTVVVVEVLENGIDPINWSMPPTPQVI